MPSFTAFADKLERGGIKPISDLLESIGLPARPPSAPSANFSWEEIAGRSRRLLGLNALISVQVAEDVRNTSRNRIVVSGSGSSQSLQRYSISFSINFYFIYSINY